MDAALEAAADGRVELPGDVGGAEDEDAARVVADAVHLNQELSFYAPRGFGLAFAAGPAQGVDFVDEDYGGFVFACEIEELFDEAEGGVWIVFSGKWLFCGAVGGGGWTGR